MLTRLIVLLGVQSKSLFLLVELSNGTKDVLPMGKSGQNNRLMPQVYSWDPILWEILDPPLISLVSCELHLFVHNGFYFLHRCQRDNGAIKKLYGQNIPIYHSLFEKKFQFPAIHLKKKSQCKSIHHAKREEKMV